MNVRGRSVFSPTPGPPRNSDKKNKDEWGSQATSLPQRPGSVWGEHAFATHLGWLGLAYLMPLVMRV